MPEIKVGRAKLDLDDVWDAITEEAFVDELHTRMGNSNERLRDAVAGYAPDDEPWPGDEVEPLFEDWGDWDRRELLAAVKNDDARRALDLLKRRA